VLLSASDGVDSDNSVKWFDDVVAAAAAISPQTVIHSTSLLAHAK
jgi:hypothetical protein